MKKNEEITPAATILASNIRSACIEAAREGFQDASMSGLCAEGAIEAAIGSMQSLDLEPIIAKAQKASSD